jgi:hypothetical protein
MWAVGCIGYEMCLRSRLAENRQAIDNYRLGRVADIDFSTINFPLIAPTYAQHIQTIICWCLRLDAISRATATSLREYIRETFRSFGNPIFG